MRAIVECDGGLMLIQDEKESFRSKCSQSCKNCDYFSLRGGGAGFGNAGAWHPDRGGTCHWRGRRVQVGTDTAICGRYKHRFSGRDLDLDAVQPEQHWIREDLGRRIR